MEEILNIMSSYRDKEKKQSQSSLEKEKEHPQSNPIYLVACKNSSLEHLEIQVSAFLNLGYKPVGGIATYFDNTLGHRVYLQAMIKEKEMIK